MLQIENISKSYGTFQALRDINLHVERGRIFGLLGPNGAGKSTLIRIINRIALADSGRILLEGHPMTDDDVRHIGYLPEERGLYKKMRVAEQAIYLARLKGLSRNDAEQALHKWLQRFEITSWANKTVEQLSKGMQQKLQFIVTVMHSPQLLIFDEPFSGFDPVNANLLKQEILRMRDEGATVILSSHNMASVEELCDDIALINKSHLVVAGGTDEVRRKYGANQVEVLYRSGGPLPRGDAYEIFSDEESKGVRRAVLNVAEGRLSREVLQEIVAGFHSRDGPGYLICRDLNLGQTLDRNLPVFVGEIVETCL